MMCDVSVICVTSVSCEMCDVMTTCVMWGDVLCDV